MGWVEELPSGRFRGVARNPLTGKKWSKTHDRWSQADAWWRREEREQDGDYTAAGLAVPRQARGIPTFAEHVVAWAKIGVEGAELSTRLGYQSQARMLARQWPTQRVDEITEGMVREYLAELRDAGLTGGTRTVRLTVLRQRCYRRRPVHRGRVHRPDRRAHRRVLAPGFLRAD